MGTIKLMPLTLALCAPEHIVLLSPEFPVFRDAQNILAGLTERWQSMRLIADSIYTSSTRKRTFISPSRYSLAFLYSPYGEHKFAVIPSCT